jgi:molybdate-binding protein
VILPPVAALILGLAARRVVLDVGGGTGALLGAIRSAVPAARAVTLDASAAMLHAASEPAALAYDLAFIPLAAERLDLVIPAGQVSSREVQGLLKVLSSAWLLDQLASLPGYDPGRCGVPIATLPARA